MENFENKNISEEEKIQMRIKRFGNVKEVKKSF